MAILKCKMCGGDLEVNGDASVLECEYCGTQQTVPNVDDEKKTNLFNRANRLRFACEFSKAAGIYENIVAEFPEEAEAYWGLCLCKYGIEYVDDPRTAKKIPTCHRTSFESIFEDENFELAQEYADSVAQKIYREEAKEIERIQRSILQIVEKEEPFDIFICYKETGEDGQRTKDSVMAQDMYDALTEKGYKVFFARITLEDKLGQEYEPYIFAALTSAKIMLSVGTKYEHFNAVWVKNEWSRFLDLMKNDNSKVLIPCYCDIDAYDMPTEFKNLQGQDMGKIGAVQDLLRGIEKLIGSKQNETIIINQGLSNIETLIKRGYIELEDENWDKAKDFFEQVLNLDPESSTAYLGLAMSEWNVSQWDKVEQYMLYHDYEDNKNYIRAEKYASSEMKESLTCMKERLSARKENEISELEKCREKIEIIENMIVGKGIFLDVSGRVFCRVYRDYLERNCVLVQWEDMKQIAFASFGCNVVGLKNDGKVLFYTGDLQYDKPEVGQWQAIQSIQGGKYFVCGIQDNDVIKVVSDASSTYIRQQKASLENLKDVVGIYDLSRGSYAARTINNNLNIYGNTGQFLLSVRNGVKRIEAKDNCLWCINQTGTVTRVRFVGSELKIEENYAEWKDIVKVVESPLVPKVYFALKKNGLVCVEKSEEVDCEYDVKQWNQIVDIACDSSVLVGLKKDGTVLVAGKTSEKTQAIEKWEDIVAVGYDLNAIIGVKKDGTIVSTEEGFKHIKLFDDVDTIEQEKAEAPQKRQYSKAIRYMSREQYSEAVNIFNRIKGYKNVDDLLVECKEKVEISKKESTYYHAKINMNQKKIDKVREAIRMFESIEEWKDSKEQIVVSQEKLRALEEEKRAKEKELKELEEKIATTGKEIQKYESVEALLKNRIDKLGIFSGKEKKRLTEEMNKNREVLDGLLQDKKNLEKKSEELKQRMNI